MVNFSYMIIYIIEVIDFISKKGRNVRDCF